MYSEKQELLRNSLWNFMGSIMENSIYEDNKKKESVTALISEEVCKFCKDEDNNIDMKAAKPILKASIWILQNRLASIEKLNESGPAVISAKTEMDNLIKDLNKYIDRL